MSKRRRVLLGDEMGLGKTIQTIATIVHTGAFPCLVICPVSLKLNWMREIRKWAIGKTATDNVHESADFVVVPYSQLTKHMVILKKATIWASIVCDESHYLKNAKTQRTKSVKAISKNINDIYLLSGTPILNKPAEFISQLEILKRLNELGGWKFFVERYCDGRQERFGLNISGASNLQELNKKLRGCCYVRRFKKDVLKELPAKHRSIVEIDISNRREYEKTEALVRLELIELRNKSRENADEILNSLTDDAEEIRQTWRGEFPKDKIPAHKNIRKLKREFGARLRRKEMMVENSEGILLLNRLKQKTLKGKMTAIKEWITDFIQSGEKLIVFCNHIVGQQELLKEFKCAGIIASMDTEERQHNVDKFQTDEDCKLIVCSLGAGGIGFNMTASSNVFFVEMGWTPAIHDQAEDRTHRIGQTNSVNAHYAVGRDTIDGEIYSLIERKREVVSAASDGKDVGGVNIMRELIDGLTK